MTITMTWQFSGRALRLAREARGLRQTELARAAEISVDALRDYERGRYAPSTDRVALLATLLDVSMDYLFTEPDETGEGGSRD